MRRAVRSACQYHPVAQRAGVVTSGEVFFRSL